MSFKRVIAREWLIILVFFFLSPPIVALYEWIRAPKETTDPSTSFALYDSFIPDDQIPILREKLTKQLESTLPRPPEGFVELVPPDDLPDTVVIEQALKGGILTYPKRSLWSYLIESSLNLDNYLAIIFTYPLFLLIRSIIWSIRTVRREGS
jgi:hypothetical protein